MPASPRVLFVGLDSADPNLLAQGCDAGWLPVLNDLRSRGVWTPVRIPRGFGNGAIWPSLATGVNPGRHGRYFYRQLKLGTYDIENFVDDSDLGRQPFWEHLGRAGRRVAVIDMVRIPLCKSINGVQINDWMTHDRTGPMRSVPADFASEVVARYGPDPVGGETDIPRERTAEEYRDLRDALIERIRTKTEACEYYLKQDSWDLFMVGFADPHDVAHQCWHLHDASHTAYDRDWVERNGDPVKDVYRELDSAIGRLLKCIGPQATIVVFAGPGMCPDYTGNFLFDQIIRRIDGRPGKGRNLIPNAIVKRLPAPIQTLARRINYAKYLHRMRRRKFLAVPHNENAGAVRINVIGREPAGCVKRGVEYDAVCRSLTQDLLDLVNVDTGGRVVQEVVRVADECHGELTDTLPDLLAVWAREAPIRAVSSPKIGVITGNPVVGARTGDHNSDCVLFAQGLGATLKGRIAPIKVEDIAPLIASIFEIALPDVDGAWPTFGKAS